MSPLRGLRLGVCALALVLSACAARPPVPALPQGPSVELTQTPFFPQDEYQCGPAALATVLVASGVEVTPEALVSQVYVPARRGSLQAEITATTRRHERVPVVLPPRLDAITDALQGGQPVLVLLNLGIDAVPVWHYAVVVGFDPSQDTLLLRSGREARQTMRRSRFDAAWARAERWAVTVTDLETLPPRVTVEAWVAAVAPFESRQQYGLAERGYRSAIRRWPQSALPQSAMGNVRAGQQDWAGAVEAYTAALSHAQTPILLNNRAYALLQLQCADAARADLHRARALQPPAALTALLDGTEKALAAMPAPGACPAAVERSLGAQ